MLLCSVTFMWSCSDDIRINDVGTVPGEEEYVDGFSLGFNIELPAQPGSRAYDVFSSFEDYENYIDTKDMFRVIFFSESGDFMFGAIDRTVTPLSTNVDRSSFNWYVRIPVNYIVDRDGNAYDVNLIREYLRTHAFKIAVLANWPNKDVVITSDGDDDDDNSRSSRSRGFSVVQPKDEPLWGYKNSIFYNGADADLKNINDLHHLVHDINYADNTRLDRPTNLEVYDFVMKKSGSEYLMGMKTDWVKMSDPFLEPNGDSGKDVAEAWIKSNWNPNGNGGLRHYSHLWYYWNFSQWDESSPYYNYSGLGWGTTTMDSEWHSRHWSGFDALFNDGERGWRAQELNEEVTIDGLTIVPVTLADESPWATWATHLELSGDGKSRYGIHLPPAINLDYNAEKKKNYVNENKVNKLPKGYLKFTAPATGTYRIKYSLSDIQGEGHLFVQRSSNIDKDEKVTSTEPVDFLSADGGYRDLSITDDAETIYIFNNGDAPVFIYAIEYVCAKYIFDTDREGVEPSADNPIPMYGVQNFPALGDYWKEGSTLNLSGSYAESEETLSIGLIRSLAKVEVFIDKSLADAHGGIKHMFMRSMNRMARCEPIDVENPTNWFWDDSSLGHSEDRCEWFDIQSYGPAFQDYTGSEGKTYDQLSSYTDYLSWFYGSWMYDYTRDSSGSIKRTLKTDGKWWNFTEHNTEGAHATGVTVNLPTAANDYPHLFYPDIYRSDFCRFINTGTAGNGDYYRYVVYMPDKSVDDPNYPGITTCVPKVPHIEYRFADQDDYNLDDNNCYRIYFTDYESGSPILGVTQKNGYADYEKTRSNLQKHWPVMRNHIYQFYVGGSGVENPVVKVKVKDWGKERTILEW